MGDESEESVPKKRKLENSKCANCLKPINKIDGVPETNDFICNICRKYLEESTCQNVKTTSSAEENFDPDDDHNMSKVSNVGEAYVSVERLAGTSASTLVSSILSSHEQDTASSDGNNEFKLVKSKRKDPKCARCDVLIRKIPGVAKAIESLQEAQSLCDSSELYLQIGDIICAKCRSILRKIESVKNRSDQRETEAIAEIEQRLSQVSTDESSQNRATSSDAGTTSFSSQKQEESQTSCTTNSSLESQGSDSTYYEPEPKTIEMIELPFPRTVTTHRYCFICGSTVTRDIIDVSFETRLYAFTKVRIFIPRRNRCCKTHLIKNRFYADELARIPIFSYDTFIEITEVQKFLGALLDKVDTGLHEKIGEKILTDEQIKALTGYTWNCIEKLNNMMKSVRISANRNTIQAITIFLIKLKTGNSNNFIAATLQIDEKVVERSIDTLLKCFEKDILPIYFGVKAHSREFLINQSSEAARKLYNLENCLAIECDGTYVRHQKSSNNTYQRKSYSGQKKVPLCKPFTICTTNGFVIDCAGPYPANKNDAEILRLVLSDPDGLSSILRPGDIFILDRGFRDIVSFLEDKGYVVLMPALKGKRNQLTVEESNASRLVTKLRWVVEAVHGAIAQKAKFLHHQLNNKYLTDAATFCKTANLLHNLFGKRLNSDDSQLDLIINRIEITKNLKNTLAEEVEKNNWNRKSQPFSVLSSDDLLDFPEISLEDLKILFTGSYQLSQAVSYLAEILQENDTLNLNYNKANPNILRFEVRSRHISSKTYKCYIHYTEDMNGIDAIERYCCNCANGNRTVGCCSHVAAIIYYLAHARYESKILRPAHHLLRLFDCNGVTPVIEEDSDED